MIELKLYKHDFDTVSWEILCEKCKVSTTYSEIIINANYIESNNYDDTSELYEKLTKYTLPKELYLNDKTVLWRSFGKFENDVWVWSELISLIVLQVRRQEIINAINKLESYYKDLESKNAKD
jgi:hypothetical protein